MSGKSLRQTAHTHCASVHQPPKLAAALLRVAGVTAGLAESNGSLPPGLWLTSPAGWLQRTLVHTHFYLKTFAITITVLTTVFAPVYTLHSSCAQRSMLHGTDTWPVRKENEVALQQAEMRMVRWMCGIKLLDRLPSKKLRERLGTDDIALVLQQNRLRWYGHWACAAKSWWWWLGKEMHGVWSRGPKTKRKTKEDLERGCPRGLSST